MPNHLDLFSGIGGFSLAAQWAGFRTVGFCEREPYAQQVLKERFGAILADAEKLQRNGCENHAGSDSEKRGQVSESGNGSRPRLHPDIFTLNGAEYAGVDLITGGFPCQPFSVAGKRLGAADDRAIWPQMLRVIDEARPDWVLGENVAGIVTMELNNVLSDLEGIGYAAWPLVIPACAVDAKHRRDRVWILAHAERSAGGPGRAERHGVVGSGSRNESSRPGENVADAYGSLGQGDKRTIRGEPERADDCKHCRWLAEPSVGRVAHGIPHRVDRLRGLGNAVVPQVVEYIGRSILHATRTENTTTFTR